VALAGLKRLSDGRTLDLDVLTEWLAQRANLPYLRVDPLKVEISKIGDLMSTSYAERHRILPVAASTEAVTIATCEPFDRGWVPEMERMLRRPIELQVSSPADITRYTVEFFNLARSVKHAQKNGSTGGVESVRAVGGTGPQRQGARRPTTPAWCRWSIGCGNTPSSSAPPTSTSSRGATWG
jgi:GSPII_E N-terminal domain.